VRALQGHSTLVVKDKVIRWHHPREAGNRTRPVASEEGEWAVSVLAVGVEMRMEEL